MPNINVMLVDDEERYLTTTQKLLEKKGYAVETAASGAEALAKLKKMNIHVVILDVKMPGMGGIATLEKIKHDFPLVEVIMLTGHATVESAVEGVKLGAADYLMKPVDIEDISEKIKSAFEKRQHIKNQKEKRDIYFKELKLKLALGLLAAFMLPYAAFFTYFQFQFSTTLKNTGRLNLEALSNSQKNTVDLFLQERVVNLFSLFHGNEFTLSPSVGIMAQCLQNLRQASDAFCDVGFLNAQGIQIGYAGPFPELQGKNYSNETWFKTLLRQDRHYFISDIYSGLRNKPHFTIAVRQVIEGAPFVMRATLDPDKFYMLLRAISRGKAVESALINKEGRYQIVDPNRGELLEKSDFIPPTDIFSGVEEIRENGNAVLIGFAWLKEAPWALLVRQPLNIAHAAMYRSRRIMTISLGIIFFSIAAGIWFANSRLIGWSKAAADKSEELRIQLFHASKLASVGELATGVAHEINNPLAVIVAASGVIKDLFDPEFGLTPSRENVMKEVEAIESAAFRARTITRQLLDFGRKNEPKLIPCHVNKILNEVMSGLKEREFKTAGIEIVREYDPGIPEILLDSDKIRQVFLNLINNAGDAITGAGTITITTRRKDQHIEVIIKDTGGGIPPELLPDIFNPFFTTKEVGKGTGLGLSVSQNIIKSLGGEIDVASTPGIGTQFTVSLPIKTKAS
ncbi:MAG: response regulator [Desulfobacterales bacterium]|jgi:two-component system NtrC family sensor kinase|nr:response regulator [Desulfobacterales bacterium]